jgi:hypothetical protein
MAHAYDKFSLIVDECFLLFQEGIGLRLARAAKCQGNSDGINARAWTFRGGFRPRCLF